MDGDEGDDVDLASYAFQIWKNAIEKDSKLENKVKSIKIHAPEVPLESRNPGFSSLPVNFGEL